MSGFIVKLKLWWETADRTQRTVTAFGSVFLIIVLFAVYSYASKPSMSVLASGLSPSDQGMVTNELQKLGIQYQIDMQGNVSVPSDKVAELRAKLSQSQKLPASGVGEDELAKLSMTTTPRVEKERLKSILEGKLATTIEMLDGVESARVQVSLGDDSPFAGDQKAASASIMIAEKAGGSISRDQARNIASLVAHGVPNLDPKNISITNRMGETLYDPSDGGANGMAGAKMAAERSESRRRERELQAKLDAMFGPGNTVASVNAELNFDKKSYDETTTTPSTKLVTEENKESMKGNPGGAAPAGGTSGLSSNRGAPGSGGSPDAGATDGKYENTNKKYDYAYNVRNTKVEQSAGDLKSMAISVMVSDKKADNAKQVEAFVAAYLGPKAADKTNFTYQVTVAPFDTSAAEAAKKSSGGGSSAMMTQLLSLIPVGALFMAAMMIIKGMAKAGKSVAGAEGSLMLNAGGQILSLPAGGISVNNTTARGLGVHPGYIEEEVEEEEDDPINPSGPKIIKKKKKRRPVEEEDDVEFDAIRKKVNIPLEQIKQMATNRPETVAMLLKSWLAEERR